MRVVDGSMKKEDKLFSMENGKSYTILEVGILHPGMCEVAELSAGQVGFMCIGMKLAAEAKIGDTFCQLSNNTQLLCIQLEDRLHSFYVSG